MACAQETFAAGEAVALSTTLELIPHTVGASMAVRGSPASTAPRAAPNGGAVEPIRQTRMANAFHEFLVGHVKLLRLPQTWDAVHNYQMGFLFRN